MEDNKKRRGCNYTVAEKEILLELLKKYQDVIENKETNAQMVSKKREAWLSVCQQYNTIAVSGIRTWQQLRHLYENMKQRSKKIVIKEKINHTVYGADKSTLTEHDDQILAMVTPQVQLGDEENHTNNSEVGDSSEFTGNTNNIDDQESSWTNTYQQNNNSQTSTPDLSAIKPRQKENRLKQQYYKAKLRNAKLENIYLINKNKMEINKYKMEMQILKLRLNKLKYNRKR